MKAWMESLAMRPGLAAGLGASLMAPFFGLNLIVANRIDPVFSWIRPGIHTGSLEYPILFALLLLIPLGAAIALAPARHPVEGHHPPSRRRRFPVVNTTVAVALVVVFVVLAVGIGEEIVRCDLLQINNCD